MDVLSKEAIAPYRRGFDTDVGPPAKFYWAISSRHEPSADEEDVMSFEVGLEFPTPWFDQVV